MLAAINEAPTAHCKEVVVGTLLFSSLIAAEKKTKTNEQHKIKYENNQVDGLKSRLTYRF